MTASESQASLNEDSSKDLPAALLAARAVATGRAGDRLGASGERVIDHAEGTLAILEQLRVDEPTRVAALLFGLNESLPLDEVATHFGEEVRVLVDGMRQLLRLRDLNLLRDGLASGEELETLRRMTLAMASDIRVVLLRLASRLQTLRHHAASRQPAPVAVARETLEVLAPLANRLGLGQLKWELEDLAFRFLEPDRYKAIARALEERRSEREAFIQAATERLKQALRAHGLRAEVTGRPKHIYSIHNKMRTKALEVSGLQDLRAFRVLVDDVKDCYAVLGVVHAMWPPLEKEFDDYIARPKPNGYQSLHTVVTAEDGRPFEIQIRTREMHQHAEFGVASHWRYKESSTGLAGASGPRGGDVPQGTSTVQWMRQLLMWQQEVGATLGGRVSTTGEGPDALIYALTPEGRVVELPQGATPIDFAYRVHTGLGHRCRGARVDGQMLPLNTALRTGQTVEIMVARHGSKPGGPSRDWLNPQLGFLRSARARSKVRQWFNALDTERDAEEGRARVERILQREGRTSLSLDELARRLRLSSPLELFLAVAREEIGPRALEDAARLAIEPGKPMAETGRGALESARPGETERGQAADAEALSRIERAGRAAGDRGHGVLVVGVDFLMTQLARCCRPIPPDPIVGFVTRGRGVSVHRQGCRSLAELLRKAPERMLQADWGSAPAAYPADVLLRARDRQGLLRDITEVFARDRINVTAVRTLSRDGMAQMQFTVEVTGAAQLATTLTSVRNVGGVTECRRM
ncbi:MAG: RelA/SpoT family protein [Burkholderiaceae bacterium]